MRSWTARRTTTSSSSSSSSDDEQETFFAACWGTPPPPPVEEDNDRFPLGPHAAGAAAAASRRAARAARCPCSREAAMTAGGGRRGGARAALAGPVPAGILPPATNVSCYVLIVWFWTGNIMCVEYSGSDQYLSAYMYMMGWNHRNVHCIRNTKQGALTVHAGCSCICISGADNLRILRMSTHDVP